MADEEGVTLFVRKLPPDVKPKEVEDLFSQYGPLAKCFVVPAKDEKAAAKGRVAFVTYSLKDDGLQAAETLDKSDFRSFTLSVEPAKSKSDLNSNRSGFGKQSGGQKRKAGGRNDAEEAGTKKARLIVRNVSFTADEAKLKKHFESFGKVDEAKLLRKGDGKLVGCGFVQFRTMHEASKALKALNAKAFLGRPIAVDWAVPKSKFEAAMVNSPEDVEDGDEPGKVETASVKEVKTESVDDEAGDGGEKKKKKRKRNPHRSRGKKRKSTVGDEGKEGEEVGGKKIKKDSINTDSREEDILDEEDEDDDEEEDDDEDGGHHEDDDDEDDEERDDEEEDGEHGETEGKKPEVSRDVREGRTVFVANVPFICNEEDLEEFMTSQFGPVKYAMFCIDPVTQHPRGTAFVQFESLEAAEKCITARDDDLMFEGRPLKVMKALPRTSAQEVTKQRDDDKDKPKKDKRNLYLAREGLVREGTQAAEGVSQYDMNLRKSLSITKKKALRDLTMFISPTRLCIHNVPFGMDDAELRTVCKKYAPRGAVITECRVMRDRKNGNVSKGFAFVNFARHEDALEVLRSTNNNPEVFTGTRRPIVEFSIENKLALQAREKRLSRSREKQTNKSRDGPAASGAVKKEKSSEGKVGPGETAASGEKPPSKREKLRLKRQRRRVSKQEQKAAENADGPAVDAKGKEGQPQGTATDEAKTLTKQEKNRLKKLRRLEKQKEGAAEGEGSQEKGQNGPPANKPKFPKKGRKPKGGAAVNEKGKQGETMGFVGAKSDPAKKGVTGLPSHDGPKVRHQTRPTSISRKLLRKKQKKPQQKQPVQVPDRNGPIKNPQGKKAPKSIPQKAKQGAPRKSADRSGAEFQSMVDKYKSILSGPKTGGQDAGAKTKWFDG